ncbi:hypothetical protein Tco_0791095 [Tanacetum coccineum]
MLSSSNSNLSSINSKIIMKYQGFEEQARKRTTMELLTLEEYVKNARDEYGWKIVETEVLNLLKISDNLFSFETPLGMTFEGFDRGIFTTSLSSMNDDLVTYEVKGPKPTYAPCVEQQTGNQTKKDLESYEWKMSYEECEKIYAEVVIFIDRRLVRLIDVTVEQWSYKRQLEDYLEIKNQRDTYACEVNMEYNPSNMIYWIRGDDEVELIDEELSILEDEDLSEVNEIAKLFSIETNLFDFKTPLCKAFNEFNYLLKVDTDLFTFDIPEFKTYDEFKNEWINEWNKEIPWNGKTKWPTCNCNDEGFCNGVELSGMIRVGYTTYFQDYEWYDDLIDEKLKKEAIYEGSWGNATQGVMNFYAWLKICFDNFHELDYELMIQLEEYWIFGNARRDKEEKSKERRCELLGVPYLKPPTCKREKFEVVKYAFGPAKEYVAIKEYEYDILVRTEENVSNAYQDIFHKKNEGWFVSRTK